jgi:hypothetical protein
VVCEFERVLVSDVTDVSMSLPAAANTSGRFRKPACDNISAMLEWYMDGVPDI